VIEIRKARAEDFTGLVQDPDALRACYNYLNASVTAWTGMIDGGLACIWGLVPPTILSDTAYLWLYTTPVLDQHKFTFVRHSQLMIEKMLEDFPVIVGHVLAGQERSKRWLKWLGVTFKPIEARGHVRLVPFELRRTLRG
jgi:hypothetical protein